MGKLYILVTADELELPVLVTESVKEMAQQTGRKYTSITSCLSKGRRIRWGKGWYRLRKVREEAET